MTRNRKIRLIISGALFVIIAWLMTPSSYINRTGRSAIAGYQVSARDRVKSQPSDDADFDRYNKPAYFSIFRFISSFIPLKSQNTGKLEQVLFFFKG